MSSDLVSVVIPTFNRAYCLARAVDSVLRQTHRELEVLVVDDGSTDDTRDVIRDRYGDEPKIRYLYQENAGVCSARNTGIAAAQGEFVALLDSDDIWHPWKLQVQVAALKFLPHVGMVWTDMEAIDSDGAIIHPRYLRTMYEAYRWFANSDLFTASYPLRDVVPEAGPIVEHATLFEGDIFSQMVMGNLVHTSTVLLRRERIRAVQGFDVRLKHSGEDYDFHLRTCREGPVAFIDLAAIQYQRGFQDQLTQPRYSIHLATNCLTTISRVLDQDRERIRLPNWMIREMLAETHAWIGESALELGDNALARRHLALSLRHKLWQPALALRLPVTVIPAGLSRRLRSVYRRLKGVARPHTASGV